ncbi:hypothetical protein HK405_013877 [Cladochytrium tenue]|nr:hypothetical protein HK405_013877 [Cladochytrium tenue]
MSSPSDVGCVVEAASAAVVTSNAQESLTRSELPTVDCCNSTPYVLLQQDCLATDGSCTFTCVCLGLDAFADISGAVLAPGSADCGSNMNCSGISGMYCGHVSSNSWEVYVHDVVSAATSTTMDTSAAGVVSATDSGTAVSDETTSQTSDAGAAASSFSSSRAGTTIASATLSASTASADPGSATTTTSLTAAIAGAVVATVVVVIAAAVLLVTWARRHRRSLTPSSMSGASATALENLATASLPRPANAWRHLPSSPASATFNPLAVVPITAAEPQQAPPPPTPAAATAPFAPWQAAGMHSPDINPVGVSSPGVLSPGAPMEVWAASMSPRPAPLPLPLDYTPSPPPDDAWPESPAVRPAANT